MPNRVKAAVLAATLFSSMLLASGPTGAVPPTPPATLEILSSPVAGTPGAAIPLRLRVARNTNVDELSVSTSIRPTESPGTDTARQWQAGAAPQGSDEAVLSVTLPTAPGQYEVEILLSGKIAGRWVVLDRAALSALVAPATGGGATPFSAPIPSRSGPAKASVLPAEGRVGGIRRWPERFRSAGPQPPEPLEGPGTGGAVGPPPGTPDLTVKGSVLFQDWDGVPRRLPFARVTVSQAGQDLGEKFADFDGAFAIPVKMAGTSPVGLSIKLDSGSVAVRPAAGATYSWSANAALPPPAGGGELDFGNLLAPTEAPLAGAASAFAVANLAWAFVDVEVGVDPGRVEIRYPADVTAYQERWWRLDLEEKAGWNPDTILHEYGHFLMDAAFALDCPDLPGDEQHTLGQPDQDPGVAFSEGWATGFALAMCPDGAYEFEPDWQGRRGDWPDCKTPSVCGFPIETYQDAGGAVGERSEGRVAAAINDLLDSADDHGGNDSSLGEIGFGDQNSGQEVAFATLYRDAMIGRCIRDTVGLRAALRDVLTGDRLTYALEAIRYNYIGRFAPASGVEAQTPEECVPPEQ